MSVMDAVLISEARRLSESGEAARRRQLARLSRGDVARAVGVKPETIGRWERQERRPTGAAAVRYGELLRGLEPS